MVQPELPQELLDMFIDELGGGGVVYPNSNISSRLALQSCLLVSRSFCHRARRHLFSSISLIHSSGKVLPRYIQHLMQFLHSELPIGGVAQHIKEVAILIAYGIPPIGPIDESVEGSLVSFLHAMIGNDYGIRDLSLIILQPAAQRFFEWDRMSVDLQKCISATVHSPHLTSVHFFHLSHIPRSVFEHKHLKHLRLKSGGWRSSQRFIQAQRTDIRTPSASEVPVHTRLECFTTDHSYPIEYFEDDSIPSFSESPFSHLTTLTSSVTAPQSFVDCMKILNRAARTIENLHLSFFLKIEEPPNPLNMQLFRQLHKLEIQYLGGHSFGPFEHGIHHIFRLLDSPSPCNCLSSIRFVVKLSAAFEYPQDGLLSSADTQIYDWLALDTLLSGPKYISVQTISFFFRIDFTTKPATPSEEAFITEAVDRLNLVFPKVRTSKLLNITVEVG